MRSKVLKLGRWKGGEKMVLLWSVRSGHCPLPKTHVNSLDQALAALAVL